MKKAETLVCPSKLELFFGALYLPVHMFLMPTVLTVCMAWLNITVSWLGFNVAYQLVALTYIVLLLRPYLQKSFSQFLRYGFGNLWAVLVGSGILIAMNVLAGIVMAFFFPGLRSPNNDAVLELAENYLYGTAVIAIFLAPVVEEVLFRGMVFAPIAQRNRFLGYLISALAFAFLHIAPYVLSAFDPSLLLTMLLYVPHGLVLAWAYERSGSIWTAIFLHMLYNGTILFLP